MRERECVCERGRERESERKSERESERDGEDRLARMMENLMATNREEINR